MGFSLKPSVPTVIVDVRTDRWPSQTTAEAPTPFPILDALTIRYGGLVNLVKRESVRRVYDGHVAIKVRFLLL